MTCLLLTLVPAYLVICTYSKVGWSKSEQKAWQTHKIHKYKHNKEEAKTIQMSPPKLTRKKPGPCGVGGGEECEGVGG